MVSWAMAEVLHIQWSFQLIVLRFRLQQLRLIFLSLAQIVLSTVMYMPW